MPGLFWWIPLGPVPEIPPAELQRWLSEPAAQVQMIDVRKRSEWEAGHIDGVQHVPIGELRDRLPELGLDPDQPIVAICLSAHRSIPAVRVLREAGYPDAVQLKGGMLAWRRADQPERRGDGSPR